MDTLTLSLRSHCISRIRGKNTKPEILVRKGLHARGFRFRLHNKKLPGSPDIVLPQVWCHYNGERMLLARAQRMSLCD